MSGKEAFYMFFCIMVMVVSAFFLGYGTRVQGEKQPNIQQIVREELNKTYVELPDGSEIFFKGSK